ncbi:MAG: hypothetical protein WC806_00840 [Candidatus Gracilibacteria bacterium]|jgi:RNA polymerase sigma-70 factor (ECF subfamily)
MDIFVEKQYLEKIKAGETIKLLSFYDAFFSDLYKYIYRRLNDSDEAERIIRLTFLDAVGQIKNTPDDMAYLVWLYSLAKPRVWTVMNKMSFPIKQGLISKEDQVKSSDSTASTETAKRVEKMFKKMSLEEGEIMRLKFFEEMSDADILYVLGGEESLIGPKIYRVLKRAHFLIFGESDIKQGVYFGELSGCMVHAKDNEGIVVPEALRLSLRADLANKIERKEIAMEVAAEPVSQQPMGNPFENPFKEVKKEKITASGSNDPAKIFVEAVTEMREEEAQEVAREQERFDKQEKIIAFFEKFKALFVVVPLVSVFAILVFVAYSFFPFGFGKVERGAYTACTAEVKFDGDFAFAMKENINSAISDAMCSYFPDAKNLVISQDGEKLKVELYRENWLLSYKYAKNGEKWYIQYYARSANSDKKSGKI